MQSHTHPQAWFVFYSTTKGTKDRKHHSASKGRYLLFVCVCMRACIKDKDNTWSGWRHRCLILCLCKREKHIKNPQLIGSWRIAWTERHPKQTTAERLTKIQQIDRHMKRPLWKESQHSHKKWIRALHSELTSLHPSLRQASKALAGGYCLERTEREKFWRILQIERHPMNSISRHIFKFWEHSTIEAD